MPRLAGVHLLGLVLAGLAIYFVGFIWYGLLFTEPWMNANGLFFADEAKKTMQWLTADGLQSVAADAGPDPMIMGLGLLLSLVLAFGLGWHMKQKGITKLATAVLFALWLSLLIGVPLMAYDLVYVPGLHIGGFLVDASHTVVTFIAGAAVLSFFD
ncbi:MAG: DUF1761 family protein [Pseudomonadota bacterium]